MNVIRLSSKVVRILLASKLASALSLPSDVHYAHVVKHKIVSLSILHFYLL